MRFNFLGRMTPNIHAEYLILALFTTFILQVRCEAVQKSVRVAEYPGPGHSKQYEERNNAEGNFTISGTRQQGPILTRRQSSEPHPGDVTVRTGDSETNQVDVVGNEKESDKEGKKESDGESDQDSSQKGDKESSKDRPVESDKSNTKVRTQQTPFAVSRKALYRDRGSTLFRYSPLEPKGVFCETRADSPSLDQVKKYLEDLQKDMSEKGYVYCDQEEYRKTAGDLLGRNNGGCKEHWTFDKNKATPAVIFETCGQWSDWSIKCRDVVERWKDIIDVCTMDIGGMERVEGYAPYLFYMNYNQAGMGIQQAAIRGGSSPLSPARGHFMAFIVFMVALIFVV
ncbi:hypothetical protein BJ508DRAFT_359230 [Ascobolus immersus RN42]|uniref:Uncharacterized protein n=1 Tax=Ascobolus immersus RN42 TaxID=1160509 RepID=A0A3N4IG58_ASCIM|nr:hypothetical protein BJ508DRAFT_359230 [Ascobolus immersus RN42]